MVALRGKGRLGPRPIATGQGGRYRSPVTKRPRIVSKFLIVVEYCQEFGRPLPGCRDTGRVQRLTQRLAASRIERAANPPEALLLRVGAPMHLINRLHQKTVGAVGCLAKQMLANGQG